MRRHVLVPPMTLRSRWNQTRLSQRTLFRETRHPIWSMSYPKEPKGSEPSQDAMTYRNRTGEVAKVCSILEQRIHASLARYTLCVRDREGTNGAYLASNHITASTVLGHNAGLPAESKSNNKNTRKYADLPLFLLPRRGAILFH
jgi:hypothetical protein